MKRFLRVFVPLVLAAAVVGCAVWYLFVYDRAFARDVLLSHARYFESNGSHNVASWFYDRAYAHANQDEEVAIELAQQYKKSGNYTKAEYTLSSAIADGGNASLYIALCKTYVEQDKLLDAVNMLDNIADPVIKAELDAQRPKAPQADQAPGFYTQYITVEITSDSGVLYVSTDGQYPSIHTDPYSGQMQLPSGETTIYALNVAENGLVSPLAIYGYTVGGVVEPAVFADEAVEAAVRQLLDIPSDTLYTDQVWAITEFEMPSGALVYSDLALMPYLRSLTIESGVSAELKVLSALPQLEKLTILDCAVSQEVLGTIANLVNLTELTLADCDLTSIAPLSNAQNLTYLDLSYNTIGNITALSGMRNLQALYMEHNALSDLSALSPLTGLTTLDVSYNAISSIVPVCTIQGLQVLDVGNNQLENLGAIDNLKALQVLSAGYNRISHVDQLYACEELERLDLSNNALTSIDSLGQLMKLRDLDFSHNQVTELPSFRKDCALVNITGSYNLLSSLEKLGGLKKLNSIVMEYNEEISSVRALANCPNLTAVNVFGTKVRDVSALTDMSILVNYSPV
jgi:Leucine-rich repeat (LRR) protein